MLTYTDTPITEIKHPVAEDAGVKLFIKREDLNHPVVSGNKWWKLKYNLEEARKLKKQTLLTFGGAFSNHIYATSGAVKELGFKSIGIIRGERTLPLNPVLTFAESCGMKLHYVSREQYRKKAEPDFINKLRKNFGDFYLIPEGGTNDLAVKGVKEFASSLPADFDYICCACGTGGTLAGLINGLSSPVKIIGFSALKGGEFLKEEVRHFVSNTSVHWEINIEYHFGGYAKSTPALRTFIQDFQKKTGIPLDSVYNGKAIFGLLDLIQKKKFREGNKILIIHTGGSWLT